MHDLDRARPLGARDARRAARRHATALAATAGGLAALLLPAIVAPAHAAPPPAVRAARSDSDANRTPAGTVPVFTVAPQRTTAPTTAPVATAPVATAPVATAPVLSAPPTTLAPTVTDAPAATTPPATTVAPAPVDSLDPQALLAAVNAQRAGVHTCGSEGTFGPVAPLTWDSRLAAAATAHAADMAAHETMSHVGSDGSDLAVRADRVGYQVWHHLGENVAAGSPTVADVMAAWMGSPGHCANLMRASFQDLGMAMAVSPSGVPYWAQEFGSLS